MPEDKKHQPPSKIKIGIVGIGATGTIVFIYLIKNLLKLKKYNNLEIYLIEKTNNFGPGLAYSTEKDFHLTNMRSGTMSIIPHQTLHFIKWLKAQKKKSLHNSYLPRKVFGQYLTHYFNKYVKKARALGLTITYVNGEVIDCIEKKKYVRLILKSRKVLVNYAILTIGHVPSTNYADLRKAKSYFHSPWDPVMDMIQDKRGKLAILGSSLTAIDAALTVFKGGHKGKVYFVSRNGLLPKIQGKFVRYKRKFITRTHLRRLTKNYKIELHLHDIIELFKKELESALQFPVDWSSLLRTDIDVQTSLKKDINNAKKNNMLYYSVLDSTSRIIPFIWKSLAMEDKKLFIDKYLSFWNAYRHCIPIENGEAIYELVKTKKLISIGGVNNITYLQRKGVFLIEYNKKNRKKHLHVKYLINATGGGMNLSKSKVSLIKNMIQSGEIQVHPCGGIHVDFKTFKVIKKDNTVSQKIFFIGPLTRGVHFYTSSIEMNALSSIKIAKHIYQKIAS